VAAQTPQPSSTPQTPTQEVLSAQAATAAPRESREWLWSSIVGVAILAAIALVPLSGSQAALRLWTSVVMYMVLAQGWNFIGGFAGYAAFGNAAFFGIGAYAVALTLNRGLPYWLGLVLAVTVAGLFAFLLGLPVLRLRGHYFAIATLGIAEALGQFVQDKNVGGSGGEVFLTPPTIPYQTQSLLFFYGFLVLCLATLLATVWVSRSRFGYALVAIRENEQAAEALGIATYWYKVVAFVLSALPTALAGGLFAYWFLSFQPTGDGAAFDASISVAVVLMTFLGGAGTILGPILGAIIYQYLDQYTLVAYNAVHGPLLGVLVIFVTLFLPQGLVRLVQELLRAPPGVYQSYPTRIREGVRRVVRFIAANGV
jgi:branched-chain amino acid transport system permease protein